MPGLCKVRMQTVDADGGWWMRMADGRCGWQTADADKTNNKNQKKEKEKCCMNKYKNKNNQLLIKKRKRQVETSPGTHCLYFDNKNGNY